MCMCCCGHAISIYIYTHHSIGPSEIHRSCGQPWVQGNLDTAWVSSKFSHPKSTRWTCSRLGVILVSHCLILVSQYFLPRFPKNQVGAARSAPWNPRRTCASPLRAFEATLQPLFTVRSKNLHSISKTSSALRAPYGLSENSVDQESHGIWHNLPCSNSLLRLGYPSFLDNSPSSHDRKIHRAFSCKPLLPDTIPDSSNLCWHE